MNGPSCSRPSRCWAENWHELQPSIVPSCSRPRRCWAEIEHEKRPTFGVNRPRSAPIAMGHHGEMQAAYNSSLTFLAMTLQRPLFACSRFKILLCSPCMAELKSCVAVHFSVQASELQRAECSRGGTLLSLPWKLPAQQVDAVARLMRMSAARKYVWVVSVFEPAYSRDISHHHHHECCSSAAYLLS